MNYCKITTEGNAMVMPNPVKVTIANPTEEQKTLIAQLDNWLPMVETEVPEYDPETQYVTCKWEEQTIDGVKYAVQVWEVHEIEEEVDNDGLQG